MRPSKLTKETQDRLISAIKAGATLEAACNYAGIDYTTFRKWMKKGESSRSGKFFEFFNAIKRAEAELEVRCALEWNKKITEDWRAAKEFLERRFPDRWGRSVTLTQESPWRVIIEDDGPNTDS